MTLEELSDKEAVLYAKVISIQGTIEEKTNQLEKLGVFSTYNNIHKEYSRLNKKLGEALRRGLFLIWYSRVEPAYLTGIPELDIEASKKIMNTLNRRLRKNVSDYELDWMISYYSNWSYVFLDFKEFTSFQDRLKLKVERPEKIDKIEMENRGQMGIYFSALN